LKEELQEQAIRDPLTDLYNRRYLEEIVLEKLQQASHDMYPISVVIMDIDHFKEIKTHMDMKPVTWCKSMWQIF
jgi:diguanylate cyclase (GGDEF)-like protein